MVNATPDSDQVGLSELLGSILPIHSQLWRCCTTRGSSTRFSVVGPTKVKAFKSFLFTEKFCCIENNDVFHYFAKSVGHNGGSLIFFFFFFF